MQMSNDMHQAEKKVPKIRDLPCYDVFTINPVNQQWGPKARRQLAEDK